jgi:hypothetical protein
MSFLRDIPYYDTTCDNLDMAILIAGHPDATPYEKAQAVAYVEAVAVSHIVLAEAITLAGYGVLIEYGLIGGEAYDASQQCQEPPGQAPSPADTGPPPLSFDDPMPVPTPSSPHIFPSAYPGDPTQPPGPDWEWRGSGPPGSSRGSWYNPNTDESLHPDLSHPGPIGPHWDYVAPDGTQWRIFPDGTIQPK